MTSNDVASSKTITTWEDSLQAIDYALDRLHFLGSAIRKASAKRLQYNVTSFLVEEDAMFQKYATAVVKLNFPEARPSLHEHLGDTIAVRRKFLLQKLRHATKLTARRNPEANKLLERGVDNPTKPQMAIISGQRRETRPSTAMQSKATQASKPNRETPAFQRIFQPASPILRSIVSSTSSVYDDSVEYPECPKVTDSDKHVKCPYCLKGLRAEHLRGPRKEEYWR